jgi:hypothetical protein
MPFHHYAPEITKTSFSAAALEALRHPKSQFSAA